MKPGENKKVVTTECFEDTQKLGFDFAKQLSSGAVVTLHGNLGSGKTTFVQGLAKGFGIKKRIISPSFIIMRTYEVGEKSKDLGIKHFYHVDLYRIETEKDIEGLGLLELINNKETIVVVEWPDKIEHLLPEDRIDLYFEYMADDKRSITFGK